MSICLQLCVVEVVSCVVLAIDERGYFRQGTVRDRCSNAGIHMINPVLIFSQICGPHNHAADCFPSTAVPAFVEDCRPERW